MDGAVIPTVCNSGDASSDASPSLDLQDGLWRSQAHRTLPALMGATDMLVCGEDLGMIPACVHPVMAELGLIGGLRHRANPQGWPAAARELVQIGCCQRC
jgi:hypothetical protein